MGIFISLPKTLECLIGTLAFTAAFAATFPKLLGILQSAGYSSARLFAWSRKKNNAILHRRFLLFMLCGLSCAVIALCFSFLGEYAATVSLSAYLIFFIVYAFADAKYALRTNVTYTPRLKRLYGVLIFTTAVMVYLAVTLLNFADYLYGNVVFDVLRYVPLAVFPLLSLPLLALANLLSKIYEYPHNKSFIKKARRKLNGAKLTVIGITGSYGKTGTKQILKELLSKKYRVLATPRSHNTPLGLALTVNSADLENYDIFIAEMGARHVGDIAELCEICPPDYSIITGICPQHLESFGSLENIVKAKGEILSATKNCAVIAPDCSGDFAAYPCKRCSADCVSDILPSCDGTEFTLELGGEKRRVKTVLLGAHSAKNIALAATLAFQLGLTADEICDGIKGLDYTEHRLQLIRSNGVNILDDGYNSNVKGAAAALEVLRLFGGRKVVVTPGLVELGILEESENYALGEKLVGLDLVILVGDTLVGPVRSGYLKSGGESEKLHTVPTLFDAQELLKGFLEEGDAVLFLNDLPDIY